jgi:hypothetical protein
MWKMRWAYHEPCLRGHNGEGRMEILIMLGIALGVLLLIVGTVIVVLNLKLFSRIWNDLDQD